VGEEKGEREELKSNPRRERKEQHVDGRKKKQLRRGGRKAPAAKGIACGRAQEATKGDHPMKKQQIAEGRT